MPVPDELKPHEILRSLGVARPASVTPVQGGMDTAIWRVEHDSRVSALRVFRSEQLKTYQREQVAMQLAEAGGVPVPRPCSKSYAGCSRKAGAQAPASPVLLSPPFAPADAPEIMGVAVAFHLIMARPDRERRYALRNNELAVHHLDGETERRTLSNAAELRAMLEENFRVNLPKAPELDAALQRLMVRAR